MIPVIPLKIPGKKPTGPCDLISLYGRVTTPVIPSKIPLNRDVAPCSNPCSTFLAFFLLRRPLSFMKSLSPVMRDNTPARLPVVLLTPLKILMIEIYPDIEFLAITPAPSAITFTESSPWVSSTLSMSPLNSLIIWLGFPRIFKLPKIE